MDFKQSFNQFKNKLISIWKKGSIQKSSRITYDVVSNITLFLIIIGTITFMFAGGVGAGYFASLVKDEPLRDYEEMKRDIYNYEETSKLYFAGNKYIGDIRADLHREEINLDEISPTLIEAVIATEDQLFYEHNGVVPKAIIRAMYQEFSSSDTKTGGSTLTQQLIKNQILTNEVSFDRKAKEILLAMRLENFFEKDEIMEAYLNIVPYGRDAAGQNVAGIQTAAKGIFGANTDELTLPQAAFLAGIPQNPYTYTPFQSNGDVKDEEGLTAGISRMQTVLKRMYQEEFITEAEYNEAKDYNIAGDFAERAPSSIEKYPAIVIELEKRAQKILLKQLAEEDGYDIEEINQNADLKEQYTLLADRALRMNGYNIHSTINKDMYEAMDKVVKNYPYYGPDRTVPEKKDEDGNPVVEQEESGAILIENDTRKILTFSPGRDHNATDRAVNHAFDAERSPGSTIKSLLVYAPAFDIGAYQPGSVVADIPFTGSYQPNNAAGVFYGLVSAREGLTKSHNVTTVNIYKDILHANPAKNYLLKMGYKNINEERQEAPSLALGTTEVSVEDNINSFATLGNNGKYEDAYMIEKITDSDGEVIYEHQSESERIFSEQATYLTIDIMRDVLTQGTATYVKPRLKHGGVDWAGKTGTSQDHHDSWFVGTNPNVTFGTWIGYDTPASVKCTGCSLSYSQRNQELWTQMVNALSDIDPETMVPSERFKQPEGIVSRSYCATSGMASSELCSKAGLVRSDIYDSRFTPNKTDDSLVGGNMPLVVVDGKEVVASAKTPSEFTTKSSGGFMFNPEFLKRKGYDKLGDLSVLIPRSNPDAWKKIGLKAGSSTLGEFDESQNKTPAAPGSVAASKSKFSWNGAKGNLIVGYRIYHNASEGGSEKLIGHTIDTSYATPKEDGIYYIRAVNYFGKESAPSKKITIKTEEEEEEEEEDDDEVDEDEDEENDKDKDKDKDKEVNKDKEDANKEDLEENEPEEPNNEEDESDEKEN